MFIERKIIYVIYFVRLLIVHIQGEKNVYPPLIFQIKKQLNKILFCGFALLALQSNAATIHYEATDLTDTIMGEDLWRYTYSVSDHSFNIDTGFVIFFAPLQYSTLENPLPVISIDWDILITQPNVFIPEQGGYDALALNNTPTLSSEFGIDFIWLGSSTPGTQAFELYDASFNTIESGNTFNANTTIPEPTALLLLSFPLLFRLKQLNDTIRYPLLNQKAFINTFAKVKIFSFCQIHQHVIY